MSLNHGTLIDLIEELGYPPDKKGMCLGYAAMGLQAMFAGDVETFDERLYFINDHIKSPHSVESFAAQIKNIEKKRRESTIKYRETFLKNADKNPFLNDADFYKVLQTQKEQLLIALGINHKISDTEFYALLKQYKGKEFLALKTYYKQLEEAKDFFDPRYFDVRIFLQLLALHYSPETFNSLFAESEKRYTQNVELTFTRALPASLLNITTSISEDKETSQTSLEYQEESLVKKIDSFAGLYTLPELKKFFELLDSSSADYPNFDPPVGFLLSSGVHGISLGFNHKIQRWQLFDAEKMPVLYAPPEQIAEEILSSFSRNNITTFSTEVYCTKEQEVAVKKWLSTLMEKPEWIKLHETKGKENLTDSYNNSLFLNALQIGDAAVVKSLLNSNKINPTQITIADEITTPLYRAALFGRANIISILLENQLVDPNKPKLDGWTPLHVAAEYGYSDVIENLFNSEFFKTDPNPQLPNGATPLYLAAQNGNVESVKILLANNADPFAKKTNGITPFYIAAQEGHLNILQLFLNKFSSNQLDLSIAIETESLLKFAYQSDYPINKGREENVNILLADCGNTIKNFTPFHAAIFFGHIEVVKTLLAAGYDIHTTTANGISGLDLAKAMNHPEIVELLKGYSEEKVVRVHFHDNRSSNPTSVVTQSIFNQSNTTVNNPAPAPSNETNRNESSTEDDSAKTRRSRKNSTS